MPYYCIECYDKIALLVDIIIVNSIVAIEKSGFKENCLIERVRGSDCGT